MKYDIMFIGPATKDCNIDFDGTESRVIGGAVTFCAPAAAAAGANVFASIKANPADADLLDTFPLPKSHTAILPSPVTTLMRNEYFTPDRERRRASCQAQSSPILPEEIPDVDCTLYHLAGLLYGDFPNALIEALSKRGKLAADVQGFLRHNENTVMNFHDWADKKQLFPCFDFIKTDAAEAEILTGSSDLRLAAAKMQAWGAREVLISHNTSMLVCDGLSFYTCPVKARNLSGRTGRGDTVFGAYLAMRIQGAPIPEALRYATACVSLKMESPGPFAGTKADVLSYIDQFY